MSKTLYKILVDGNSCHSGDMKWSLPKDGNPGNWHTHEGHIKICENGLHLTTEPYNWYTWGCTAYEAEAEDIITWQDDKCVARKARLIKEIPHPKWWIDAQTWVKSLSSIPWLKPDGKPNTEWKLFPTRDAARHAARDAAWDAARDAALQAGMIITQDLHIEDSHRTHVLKRMEVWQKGYGLLCDVNGILYVYEKI